MEVAIHLLNTSARWRGLVEDVEELVVSRVYQDNVAVGEGGAWVATDDDARGPPRSPAVACCREPGIPIRLPDEYAIWGLTGLTVTAGLSASLSVVATRGGPSSGPDGVSRTRAAITTLAVVTVEPCGPATGEKARADR